MTTRVRQEIAMSGRRVLGTYRYRDLFQVVPMHSDAETLEWAVGHYPCLIEYRYQVPELKETAFNPELPEHVIAPTLDDEASRKEKKWIFLMLSLFLTSDFFQYRNSLNEFQWFLQVPKDTKQTTIQQVPQWGHPGYNYNGVSAIIGDSYSEVHAPLLRLVDTNEYYRNETPQQIVVGKTTEDLELPDRINEFLDRYASLDPALKIPLLSASYLLKQGIQLFSQAPSLAFASCVSALETLVAAEHQDEPEESCPECGQPRYHVRQRFLDFITKYGSQTAEDRKAADFVYKRRSGILHKGELYLGEVESKSLEHFENWGNDDEVRRKVIRFFRMCIINWLLSHTGAAR